MCITRRKIFQSLFIPVLTCLLFTITIDVCAQDEKILLANEYYNTGELEKAKDIYESLARRPKNIPRIHSNYLELLTSTGDFKGAEVYIDRVLKFYSNFVNYHIDKGIIYKSKGDQERAEKYFDKIIDLVKKGNFDVRATAQYFMRKRISEYAVETFKIGRKKENDKYKYALELANVYRLTSNKDMMVEEYINFLKAHPENAEYVKNTFQNLLTEKDELIGMQDYLFDKIQEQPNEEIYNELLIWVNLQLKNFRQAFIQARAFDKRFKTGGQKTMEVGIIAFENKDYKNTVTIFEYLIKAFPKSDNYVMAKKYLIKAREETVKNTFPIDTVEIRKLIVDYDALVNQVGFNPVTLEVMRSEALLYAFYLEQKDKAIEILNEIIKRPRVNSNLVARCKLDLGDIYLLIGQPWESTLLYSQVEKAKKEQPLGYQAKLKNAKLSYYNGDFSLAQSHLDILKLATSREISNDAMQLSLLIKDNTMLDTTDMAMKTYASIDLLLFQNKKQQAIEELDKMLKDYEGHRITDEIYWLQAKILLELGQFDDSIILLDKIVNEYPYDILSDDAYFLMGKIYEEQLFDNQRSMEIYQDFLTKYPGSLFSAEARKRFRRLRGDLIN